MHSQLAAIAIFDKVAKKKTGCGKRVVLGCLNSEKLSWLNGQAFSFGVLEQGTLASAGDQTVRPTFRFWQHPPVDPRRIGARDFSDGLDPGRQAAIWAAELTNEAIGGVQVFAISHPPIIAEIAISRQGGSEIRNSSVAIFQQRDYCGRARKQFSSCQIARAGVAMGHRAVAKRARDAATISPEQTILATWLDRGLRKKGKSAKALAAILGLKSPAAVTRMRKNERRIQAHELGRISAYIQEAIPRIGGSDSADYVYTEPGNTGVPQSLLGSAQAVPTIKVEVVIAAGVWRDVGNVHMLIAEKIAGSVDPRARGVKQYACKIEAEPNRYAICIPYKEIRPKPVNNDTVHVRRRRGTQYEDTLRIIRLVNGQVRLLLKGGPDKSNVIEYPGQKGEDVEIKGLVIGYHESVPF